MNPDKQPHVGLFVTCLANVFRPSVAEATRELLEEAGCIVSVPLNQSCCGQPGYNAGNIDSAAPIARQVIETFESFDYVVLPSGSCGGMIKHHYPKLFKSDPAWRERANELGAKTFEITSFLVDILDFQPRQTVDVGERVVTYHDSCAGLRELGIKSQPRRLLEARCDVGITEMNGTDVCCGFGGTFCAKMPEISLAMGDEKLANADAVGATTLVGGDLGCLLNLAGRAGFRGNKLEVRHVVELLTDRLGEPSLGEEAQ
jgi:L-lactate dehydrogenase complex protein LldE